MRRLQWLAIIGLLVSLASEADAQIQLDDDGKLTLYGDLRFRFEEDWDSRRPDGTLRDARGRLRLRARLGLSWSPVDVVDVGFRLRSGRRISQQSPHLTFWDFDGNGRDPAELVFDRWFLSVGHDDTVVWFGRNSDPFWKQDELFWDDDVSLTGGTLRHRWDGQRSDFRLVGGFYLLPDGMEGFAGRLLAGQLVYDDQGSRIGTTLATGIFLIDGADTTEHLRHGNGTRDYEIFTANAQARLRHSRFPVTVGVDFMHNLENYSPEDPDPVTAANFDQTTGVVASIAVGRARERWDWLVAYYYAHIETFAVNASFAEDDWIRWGARGQTDASDMKGHELRFVMAFTQDLNLVARLYLARAITTVQDGKRFRADLNYRF